MHENKESDNIWNIETIASDLIMYGKVKQQTSVLSVTLPTVLGVHLLHPLQTAPRQFCCKLQHFINCIFNLSEFLIRFVSNIKILIPYFSKLSAKINSKNLKTGGVVFAILMRDEFLTFTCM